MSNIFSKIFATVILLAVVYILCVFLVPDFADNYGNAELNQKIRHIKEASLGISSPDGSFSSSF